MDKTNKLINELKKSFRELIEGITKRDILFVLIFPCIITFLMFLPKTTIQILKLNIKEPSWWQYITNAFVHNNWAHYAGNIFVYFVYVTLILLIANLGNIKKEFYKLFSFIIISLPIVSSFIQVIAYPIILYWLPNLKYSAGSSGIISALSGFLPLFWIIYVKNKNPELKVNIDFMLFFMIYIVLVFAFKYSQIPSLILFLLTMLGFLFLTNWRVFKISFSEILKEIKENPFKAWIIIMIPLFFILIPHIIFPSVKHLFNNGSFTDIGLHYVGIIYGLIVSGFYFILIKKHLLIP